MFMEVYIQIFFVSEIHIEIDIINSFKRNLINLI